jgi:uncharacterized protein
MVRRIFPSLSFLIWLTLAPLPALPEATFPFPAGEVRAYKTLKSWKSLRDSNVVKQAFDYSCGAGALATLMKIGFREEVSEKEIINEILQGKTDAEQDDIKANGYSLLDLKRAAEAKGYQAAVYNLEIDHLFQLQGPVLIYFEPRGEKHFAVLKYVKGDRVYLADPARGNIRFNIYRFAEQWPGYILAIDKP